MVKAIFLFVAAVTMMNKLCQGASFDELVSGYRGSLAFREYCKAEGHIATVVDSPFAMHANVKSDEDIIYIAKDGNIKLDVRMVTASKDGDVLSESKSHSVATCLDNKWYFVDLPIGTEGLKVVTQADSVAARNSELISFVGPLFGYLDGNDGLTIDKILESGTSKVVEDKTEMVNGHICYAIKCDTKFGLIKAWICKSENYALYKLAFSRQVNDLFDKTRLADIHITGSAGSQLQKWDLILDQIQYLNDGHKMFPTHGVAITSVVNAANHLQTTKREFTWNSITEVSDIAAKTIFKVDVPNGTAVFDADNSDSPINLQWRDGAVVHSEQTTDKAAIDKKIPLGSD